MKHKPRSLEQAGLHKWLEQIGVDPDEFIKMVDTGARPTFLLKLYGDKIHNWRTMIKYLDQLARERGLDSRHQLYS